MFWKIKLRYHSQQGGIFFQTIKLAKTESLTWKIIFIGFKNGLITGIN